MSGFWNGVKTVGGWLRVLVDETLGPLSNLVGCLGGGIVGTLVEMVKAATDLSPLSAQTKDIMREFFPTNDLDAVTIATHTYVPLGRAAMTLGHRIYFRDGFDECAFEDMSMLMHELVHVRQFEGHGWAGFMCEYGRQWLDRGYQLAWFELEASNFQFDHAAALREAVETACSPVPGGGGATAGGRVFDDPFWLLWGTTN